MIDIAEQWKLHLCLFILNPKYCQNEFDQMLVRCMINISNISNISFYDFIKITIWTFLTVDIYHFKLSCIHLFKK